MRGLRSKGFLALLTGVVVASASAAIAISASTTQLIIDTTAVHLRIQKATLNNYDSGWHIHPGLVVVNVREGSLQVYEDGCTPKTVGAGETTIEAPYTPIRVLTAHAVETVTFILNGPDQVAVPLSAYSPGYNPCPSLP
jgi:NaMN:DMB phosphoribosyltransferase